ncbi:unnamed protein product [Adineta steineri]|uniref:G-protein coupled receptors family 1 profile domain-containing protein n=1 Tax=Adineta steineri TaxID=433720 RepID=A0A814VII4_9BILA|nr:unnamed protein product [Adineta steineri]
MSSSFFTQTLNFVTQYTFYSGCVTFILGIIGNAINILVFSQLKLFRDNRCAFYLILESISNFLFHFVFMTLTIFTSIFGDDGTSRFPAWCKLRYILGPTFAVITYYMICFTTIDQYFSTHCRYNLRQICTIKSTHISAFIIISIAIIHSIILGSFFNIQPLVGCVISNEIYLQYTTFLYYPVLIGLLPIVITLFFSLLAYRNVRRIVRRQLPIVRRRLDRQMTAMIVIRVVFFICLVLPYNICRIYVTIYPISRDDMLRYVIVRLVQAITFSFSQANYTVGFYLFMISSSRFRRQVKYVIFKKLWPRCKQGCCLKNNEVVPENFEESGNHNIELEDAS